jgi:hypothetical protein
VEIEHKPRARRIATQSSGLHGEFSPSGDWARYGYVARFAHLFGVERLKGNVGKGPDVMWRAVAEREWEEMRRSGVIPKGEAVHNRKPDHALYFATPAGAAPYAGYFAPLEDRPRVGGPRAYVVKVRRPAPERVRENGNELYVHGLPSVSDILAVYEVRSVVERDGAPEAYAYRAVDVDEMLAAPAAATASCP